MTKKNLFSDFVIPAVMRLNDDALKHLARTCTPEKEGPVNYQSPKNSIKPRWFKLWRNLLFYYRLTEVGGIADPEAVGLFVLDRYKVLAEKGIGNGNAFCITFEGEGYARKHIFHCKNTMQCQEWVHVLNKANYDNIRCQVRDLLETKSAITNDMVERTRWSVLQQLMPNNAKTQIFFNDICKRNPLVPVFEKQQQDKHSQRMNLGQLTAPAIPPRPESFKTFNDTNTVGKGNLLISQTKDQPSNSKKAVKSRFYAPIQFETDSKSSTKFDALSEPFHTAGQSSSARNATLPRERSAPLISRPSGDWDFKDLLGPHGPPGVNQGNTNIPTDRRYSSDLSMKPDPTKPVSNVDLLLDLFDDSTSRGTGADVLPTQQSGVPSQTMPDPVSFNWNHYPSNNSLDSLSAASPELNSTQPGALQGWEIFEK